jgi:GNAT superfamily N-acetyltransferase
MKLLKEQIVNGFLFSMEKSKLDVNYIHSFLSNQSYWARSVPLNVVERSIQNSLTVGVYENEKQVGFARVVTDYATFGYLADVFIDERYRGKGLSKQLMSFILTIPELKGLRRMMLGTRDAHGLYTQFGFNPIKAPERFMELHNENIYQIASTNML